MLVVAPAADTPLARLEERLAEQEAALADWRRRLDEGRQPAVAARTGPERAQTEISTGQVRMAAIEAMLASGREAGRDTAPLLSRSAATRSPPNGMRSTPSSRCAARSSPATAA